MTTSTTTHGVDGVIGAERNGGRDACNGNETGEFDDSSVDGENTSWETMIFTREVSLYYCGKYFKRYRRKELMEAHEEKCTKICSQKRL